jgi:beta-carotene hydroxylase
MSISTREQEWRKPAIDELGLDLLSVGKWKRVRSLTLPFLCTFGFFDAGAGGWWPVSIAFAMAHSFFTYGSVSHDLVHRSLRLPDWLNETLLFLIEVSGFRSGHAYRATHLNHHQRFPHEDDIEARTARMDLFGTLLDGPVTQPRLWWWALQKTRGPTRTWILAEGGIILALLAVCVMAWPVTCVPAAYAGLIIAGSWIFPLMTVFIPHNAEGRNVLEHTRWFRGRVLGWLAFDHLYHLEHHLYPQVPHHHWAVLARRLAPYLSGQGLKQVVLWK